MTIKKVDGGWLVDEQPGGRGGKRYRKTVRTQAEAKQYQAWLKTKVTSQPDWQPQRAESRRLKDLITEWHAHHGTTLRSGADQKKRLEALADAMGNPIADRLEAEDFANYRTKRISAGISPANCNREHAYLRALFNELARLGKWDKPNPVSKLKQFKEPESELAYLDAKQIEMLLSELAKSSNVHALLISKVALSCGSRWGETEQLTTSQVRDGKVQFARTKTDKNRTVPIDAELEAALNEHFKKHGTGNRFFQYAEGAFREAIERASIELPRGQMTHILRHTFASAFMQGGGNILTLQRLIGHKDLKTTMRYAHLAPDHLQEALALNPLAQMRARDNQAKTGENPPAATKPTPKSDDLRA